MMNQQALQQHIEQSIRTALGDLSLQLLVARSTQTLLEEENKELKTKLAKLTAGSEAKKEEGKETEP